MEWSSSDEKGIICQGHNLIEIERNHITEGLEVEGCRVKTKF